MESAIGFAGFRCPFFHQARFDFVAFIPEAIRSGFDGGADHGDQAGVAACLVVELPIPVSEADSEAAATANKTPHRTAIWRFLVMVAFTHGGRWAQRWTKSGA
jgi:hypothetical protein